MKQDLIDLLKNCLTAMNNATEEDIAEMQAVYDREVNRPKTFDNLGFEVIYNPEPLSDEELVELLGQEFMNTLTNLK